MRSILSIIVFLFFAALFWGSYNLGVFKPVKISEAGATHPFHLLAKAHAGSYHEISPVITEVENWAKEQGIQCKITFGFYIDDPNVVENARLRSKGGCILNEEDLNKIRSIPLQEGYSLELIEQQKYLVAYFEGSPWIGPYKVYGKAESVLYASGKNTVFPVLEAYETDGKSIQTTYYFRLK